MGKLQLGKLEHRISFYRDATIISAQTGEQINQVQTIKENRWGSVKYIGSPSAGSSEEEINDQRTGKIKIEVQCRFFSGLRFEDWIQFEGGRFRIYSIQTLGRNEGYSLRAELRDDDTAMLPTGAVLDSSTPVPATSLAPLVGLNEVTGLPEAIASVDTGYEFTGGFADRVAGQTGAEDFGTDVQYTQAMATSDTWLRFGFNETSQAANDVAYFPVTDTTFNQEKGLFGGIHMPDGVENMFHFYDQDPNHDAVGTLSNGDPYTIGQGSYDLSGANVGDLCKFRFSFNATPQIANSTLEVGLIFMTRDSNNNITFKFPLTTQPIYFGTGTQGNEYLNRVEMSAYIASDEDRNALALPAVRCNNEILIAPLSTLFTIIR
jgi:hypothetical protein